jgi:hypothetical protein
MTRRFAVVYEKAESNGAAYIPDLPGCITTGSTLEETKHNIGVSRVSTDVLRKAEMKSGPETPRVDRRCGPGPSAMQAG